MSKIDSNLSEPIVQGLAAQLEQCVFPDVLVTVEGTDFECHRFILSACSDFFQAIFTSGKSEDSKIEYCFHDTHGAESKKDVAAWVELSQITPVVFSLILEMVYKGKNILTAENVFDVWQAASFLKIKAVTPRCEAFQMRTLNNNNCVMIFTAAKFLDSRQLMAVTWDRIIKEFENIQRSDDLLRLDFEDMKRLVSDVNLRVKSEDTVVDLILRWIQHADNEQTEIEGNPDALRRFAHREQCLPDLLSASRLCLVSTTCISALINQPLVLKNLAAFFHVQKAAKYHLLPDRRHDFCPSSAVHRLSSQMQNVILSIGENKGAIGMSGRTDNGMLFQLASPPSVMSKCRAVMYEDDMYVTSANKTGQFWKYTSGSNHWKRLPDLNTPRISHSLICLNNYIYAVGGDGCLDIERFNIYVEQKRPGAGRWETVGQLNLEIKDPVTTTFGTDIIIVFGTKTPIPTSTLIQSFNTQTLSAHSYELDLPGPSRNMVCFRKREDAFVLQKTGALWKITNCNGHEMSMEFQGTIWAGSSFELSNATLFNGQLLVLGARLSENMAGEWEAKNQTSFSTVKVIEGKANCFLNGVIDKEFLTSA